jgi:hypothetical protein
MEQHYPTKIDALGCPRNAQNEVPAIMTVPGKYALVLLVRGAARSPDLDKFALFLQPVADGRRDCRSRTVKLIHL